LPVKENTNASDPDRLLRLGGERRGEHGSEPSDEGSAVHSIT